MSLPCQNAALLEITCHGSIKHQFKIKDQLTAPPGRDTKHSNLYIYIFMKLFCSVSCQGDMLRTIMVAFRLPISELWPFDCFHVYFAYSIFVYTP